MWALRLGKNRSPPRRPGILKEGDETSFLAYCDLREALKLSFRVGDLLSAEKDIGWHRGIKL